MTVVKVAECGGAGSCALSTRVPDPSPVMDTNLSLMGPGILSSTRAGEFPDSNSRESTLFLQMIIALQ